MSKLRQVLTLYDLVIFGVGIIVGAGIYSLIGEAAGVAGHGVWLSVVIAGFVSLLTGLSFAEMSGIYPSTHGYYQLLKNSLKIFGGKLWGFVVQSMLIFASIFAIVTIALSFAGYLNSIVQINPILVSFAVIAISGLITFIGIRESSRTVTIMALFEIFGLFVVIVAGFFYTTSNYSNLLNFDFGPNIFLASALIFFAYTGFELLPAQSEEAKSPRKYLPKAIMIAISISIIIYVLVAVALSNLMNPTDLANSNSPLTDVISRVLGPEMSFIVLLAALSATSSGVLGIIVAGSRLLYGLGKQKLVPEHFSKVFPRLRTPYIAIMGISAASIFFVLIMDSLTQVALLANLMTLFTFLLVNISIIALRVRNPKLHRHFKVPFAVANVPIPSVIAVISILMMITQFSVETLKWGLAIVLASIAFYFVADGGD
ncbi:amino acid permease [archaeon]|nr:MAG: amino acid permease [archaeon]